MVRHRRDEHGYTLLELVIAFSLFAIVALGVMTLMTTAFRSVVVARSDQVAKREAERVLERMRALPFYESWATVSDSVDVLDIYFPDTGSGYDSASMTYTSTWSPTTDLRNASIEVSAQFILDTEGTPVAPASDYDHDTVGSDAPPSRLLAVSIGVTWDSSGTERSYELETTVGDKSFTDLVGESSAAAGAVEVATTWTDAGSGAETDVSSRVLDASSTAFIGDNVTAGSTAIGGRLENAASDGTSCTQVGADSSASAPPDATTPAESSGPLDLFVPCDTSTDLAASLPPTQTLGLSASLPDGLPGTNGEALLHPASASSARSFAVYGNTVGDSLRKLVADAPIVELERRASESPAVRTDALASSGSLGSFDASAELEDIAEVRILPTEFAPEGVIQIDLDTASVTCTASEDLGFSSASGSFGGTVRHWSAGEASTSPARSISTTTATCRSRSRLREAPIRSPQSIRPTQSWSSSTEPTPLASRS